MRLARASVALAAALASMALASAARADILITIDKSTQRMTVEEDGALLFTWPVSTGAPGYDTPSGEFKPFRMERDHFSREWDDAPMPHSIFFTREGHAIHGSGHIMAIGTPASHGCVRLEPKNATVLFGLVKHAGMSHTKVVLTGETPEKPDAPVARRNQNKRNGTVVASDDADDVPFAPPPRRHVRSPPRSRYYTRYYYYWPRQYYYSRPFFPFD
jgi:L,D-transpeptidase catalytic domain